MNGIAWALTHEMHVYVATLPEGDDPDSFVRREGGPALERLIEAAVEIHEWRKAHTPPPALPFWINAEETSQ